MNGYATAGIVVLAILVLVGLALAIASAVKGKSPRKAVMRATVGQYPGCPAGMASYVMMTDDLKNNTLTTFDMDVPTCAVWPEGTPFPSGGLTAASWIGGNAGTAPITIVDGNTGNVVATLPSTNSLAQCQMQCDLSLACQELQNFSGCST